MWLKRNTVFAGSVQGTFLIHKFHLKNPEDLDILIKVLQNETAWLNALIKRSLSYKKNTVSMSFL